MPKREACARSRAMRADFVELLVASGAVDALASLFALHDRPKQDVEPVPPAIIAGLRMLEALLDARVPAPGAELGEDHAAGIVPRAARRRAGRRRRLSPTASHPRGLSSRR